MTADQVRLHLRYTGWASRKLMDAVRALPPEDATRPTGVSHGSIVGTLAHVHFADRIWYTRVGDPNEPVIKECDFATLEARWPEIQQKWERWAEAQDDAGVNRVIRYVGIGDKTYENPAWQIVMHVVNHGTLHRGQAVGMIRQLGVKPPATDLIGFYRELSAAATAP